VSNPALFDRHVVKYGYELAGLLSEYRGRIAWRRTLRQHLSEFEKVEVLPIWIFHRENARPLREAIKYLDGVIENRRCEICRSLETRTQGSDTAAVLPAAATLSSRAASSELRAHAPVAPGRKTDSQASLF